MILDHFRVDEFSCPCCGANNMDPRFLLDLDRAREFAGCVFVINSGYRCQRNNLLVSGKPDSAHLSGHAADIRATTTRRRYKVLDGLIRAGFERIGIYDRWIHVDNDPSKPPEICYLG